MFSNLDLLIETQKSLQFTESGAPKKKKNGQEFLNWLLWEEWNGVGRRWSLSLWI